jgi:hypothetical protein
MNIICDSVTAMGLVRTGNWAQAIYSVKTIAQVVINDASISAGLSQS